MESLNTKIIGHWEPDIAEYEILIFDYQTYSWGNEKGRWAIEGEEIWLIRDNLHDGIKWFLDLQDDNNLILKNPEDFLYQRGGNYLYYQITSPKISISFKSQASSSLWSRHFSSWRSATGSPVVKMPSILAVVVT